MRTGITAPEVAALDNDDRARVHAWVTSLGDQAERARRAFEMDTQRFKQLVRYYTWASRAERPMKMKSAPAISCRQIQRLNAIVEFPQLDAVRRTIRKSDKNAEGAKNTDALRKCLTQARCFQEVASAVADFDPMSQVRKHFDFPCITLLIEKLYQFQSDIPDWDIIFIFLKRIEGYEKWNPTVRINMLKVALHCKRNGLPVAVEGNHGLEAFVRDLTSHSDKDADTEAQLLAQLTE